MNILKLTFAIRLMHLARKTEELFLQTQRRSFFVTVFEIAFRVVVRDSGEFNPFLMHTG